MSTGGCNRGQSIVIVDSLFLPTVETVEMVDFLRLPTVKTVGNGWGYIYI